MFFDNNVIVVCTKTHLPGENMKRLQLEQSNDEFYTSHSGLALAGACINRHSDLQRLVSRQSRGSTQIADIDILPKPPGATPAG